MCSTLKLSCKFRIFKNQPMSPKYQANYFTWGEIWMLLSTTYFAFKAEKSWKQAIFIQTQLLTLLALGDAFYLVQTHLIEKLKPGKFLQHTHKEEIDTMNGLPFILSFIRSLFIESSYISSFFLFIWWENFSYIYSLAQKKWHSPSYLGELMKTI